MNYKCKYIIFLNTKDKDIKKEMETTFNCILHPLIDNQKHDINIVKLEIELNYDFKDWSIEKALSNERKENDKSKK